MNKPITFSRNQLWEIAFALQARKRNQAEMIRKSKSWGDSWAPIRETDMANLQEAAKANRKVMDAIRGI